MKMINSLLLGVVIGILIAPEKGTETRKKIVRAVDDAKDCVADFVDKTKSNFEEMVGMGEEEMMEDRV